MFEIASKNLDVGPSPCRKGPIDPNDVARLYADGNFISKPCSLKFMGIPLGIEQFGLIDPAVSPIDGDSAGFSGPGASVPVFPSNLAI